MHSSATHGTPVVTSWSHHAQSDVQAQHPLLTLPRFSKHVIKGRCTSAFSQNLTSSLGQSHIHSTSFAPLPVLLTRARNLSTSQFRVWEPVHHTPAPFSNLRVTPFFLRSYFSDYLNASYIGIYTYMYIWAQPHTLRHTTINVDHFKQLIFVKLITD